jgi:hypothetical protein
MTTDNLYIQTAEGTGTRKMYVTPYGQVFAPPGIDKYYNLGPSDFQPWASSDIGSADAVIDYMIGEASGDAIPCQLSYGENNNNNFFATLHIPHGAELVSVKARVWDTEEDRDWIVHVYSLSMLDGDPTSNEGGVVDLFLQSNVSNGYQTVQDSFYSDPIVDNENNLYVVVITVVGEFDLLPDTDAMKFISMSVKYKDPVY